MTLVQCDPLSVECETTIALFELGSNSVVETYISSLRGLVAPSSIWSHGLSMNVYGEIPRIPSAGLDHVVPPFDECSKTMSATVPDTSSIPPMNVVPVVLYPTTGSPTPKAPDTFPRQLWFQVDPPSCE